MWKKIAAWRRRPTIVLLKSSGSEAETSLQRIVLDVGGNDGLAICRDQMLWRLTRIVLLISLLAEVAPGQPPPPPVQAGKRPLSVDATTHSVQWAQLPLGEAVARLTSAAGVNILADRRIDPNQTVNLSLSDASAEEIVAALAGACQLGVARFDRLFYLGPPQVAARLTTLAAMRRKEIATLSTKERQALLEQRRIAWPRLTQPRDLVVRLLEDRGWHVEHAERIPLDLWPAGELPQLALADQLTLLLAGFDRTYHVISEQHAIEIIPVDWQQIQPAATEIAPTKRPTPPTAGGRKVFTLHVENQPVGLVLDQLARRLGWKLTVDEAAIRAASRSLDRRVSFTVENVDADQLLDALLAPAGLKAQRDGKNVQVAPR